MTKSIEIKSVLKALNIEAQNAGTSTAPNGLILAII